MTAEWLLPLPEGWPQPLGCDGPPRGYLPTHVVQSTTYGPQPGVALWMRVVNDHPAHDQDALDRVRADHRLVQAQVEARGDHLSSGTLGIEVGFFRFAVWRGQLTQR